MSIKRTLIKATASLCAVALLGTAIIGVAHTPWGRPLLKLPLLSGLAHRAGCPVGSIEPDAFEQIRTHKLQGDVGTAEAAAHPALGFTLGQTRRADIAGWVNAERADCRAGFVASVLECENVAAAGAPPITHLRLQFDAQDRLVSVDLFRSQGASEALVERFKALGHQLDAQVGPATSTVGTPSVAFVTRTPMQTVVQSHSYRDYVAKATLLNLGKRGLRLREQYQWLPPRS
jgi:hypothetical protein